jgi:hypothetical protein
MLTMEREHEVETITLSAYRAASEPWRIERLKRLAADDYTGGVIALNDHEGCLSVNWKGPSVSWHELITVVEFWGREENEDPDCINHYVDGILIISGFPDKRSNLFNDEHEQLESLV